VPVVARFTSKASHRDVAVDRGNIEKALDALLRAAK
jgi:hypothetical protein